MNDVQAARTEAAIRRAIVAMSKAFNAHDATAAARMYAVDADLVTVRGEWFRGRDEIERGLARIFATRLRLATQRTKRVSVRIVDSDLALAHVVTEVCGLVRSDGQPVPPHREFNVRVFVRVAGRWRIAAFHNTILKPFE